jgi:polysaccharide export outer membrane protein
MRPCRLLLGFVAGLALAGCANSPYGAYNARDARAQASLSELDVRAYGALQPKLAAALQPQHSVVASRHEQVASAQASATPKAVAAAAAEDAFAADASVTVGKRPVSPLAFLFQPAPRQPSVVVAQAREVMPIVMEPEGPYRLDSGDRLRIVVFGQDTLSNNYIVDAEGRISFPLIGSVRARGATPTQLAASIRSALANGFIREPNVSVEVEIHRPFYVMGEVTYPGLYPYVPGMTVENAVAIAGGFTPRGYKYNAIVTRKIEGVPTRLTMPIRTPVHPGDTITVKERWF